MSSRSTGTAPATQDVPATSPDHTPSDAAWLFNQFLKRVPGVTNALLASHDGLILTTDSATGKDAADSYAAAISGLSSLATSMPGASGKRLPASQILIERRDHLFLIMAAGEVDRSAFRPGAGLSGLAHGVLLVVTEADADANLVGNEMEKLIRSFSQYMLTPVRRGPGSAGGDGSQADTQ